MPDATMNPDIRTTDIGVKSLKEITIYPLSFVDQVSATEIIFSAVNTVASFGENITDKEAVTKCIELIEKNIVGLLNLVTDEGIPLSDLTNNQLNKIVTIIFDVNYKDISKNLKDLFGKMKSVLPLERS